MNDALVQVGKMLIRVEHNNPNAEKIQATFFFGNQRPFIQQQNGLQGEKHQNEEQSPAKGA